MSDLKKKAGKKKGAPKSGGREKGTPNRSSLYIRAELELAGINLVERFLLEVDQLEKPEDRLVELHWLFQYVFPKLKDVESLSDTPPPPPPAAPAAGELASPPQPPAPLSREERLALVRGQVPGKPQASG